MFHWFFFGCREFKRDKVFFCGLFSKGNKQKRERILFQGDAIRKAIIVVLFVIIWVVHFGSSLSTNCNLDLDISFMKKNVFLVDYCYFFLLLCVSCTMIVSPSDLFRMHVRSWTPSCLHDLVISNTSMQDWNGGLLNHVIG